MSQNLYNVVFRGMLTGTRSEDEVKVELAALFKASAEKIEALFSGRPVVIKRNIDAATATKFRAAFERAGAFCELVKVEEAAAPAEPESADAASPEPAPPQSDARPDDAGADVEEVTAAPPPPPEPEPAAGAGEDADSIARSGDPNGTVLERSVSAEAARLAIDESDRPHQPHEDVPPPQVDISSLSLAEDDTPLSQRPKEPPRDFDISGMTLEPPPDQHSRETD